MCGKTTFICYLSDEMQDDIKQQVKIALSNNPPRIKKRLIDEAMSGRLCDIEDLIDISKYIK